MILINLGNRLAILSTRLSPKDKGPYPIISFYTVCFLFHISVQSIKGGQPLEVYSSYGTLMYMYLYRTCSSNDIDTSYILLSVPQYKSEANITPCIL